jgi:fluoride exporter
MLDPAAPTGRQQVDAAGDRRAAAPGRGLAGAQLSALAVISLGGVIGALARYALNVTLPHGPAGFPWATFGCNVSGCLLIGVLMASIDQFGAHRLIRPFLGVGVLGGYTTFSTYIVEVQQALDAGAARLALAYLAGTLAAALVAVWTGSALALAVAGRPARIARAMGRPRGAGRR